MNTVPPFARYYSALGEFVHRFSEVEVFLKIVCASIASVDQVTAKALFSEFSLNQSIAAIRGMVTGKFEKHLPLLEKALKQTIDISRKRNKIIHLGAQFTATGFDVMNPLNQIDGKDPKSFLLEIPDLENMISDLNSIRNCLAAFLIRAAYEIPGTVSSGPVPEVFLVSFERGARAPWRYIPHEQRKRGSSAKQGD